MCKKINKNIISFFIHAHPLIKLSAYVFSVIFIYKSIIVMINYRKGKNVEDELTKEQIPIANLPDDFVWMHVKGGTKVSNVVDYAKKAMASGGANSSVVWTGSGGGIGKTVSCAEIMKRDMPDVHQITRLSYRQ